MSDDDPMRESVRALFAPDEDAIRLTISATPETQHDPELRRFAADLFAKPTTKENS